MDDYSGYLIGGALVILVVLLILREFRCWYWKVNEIVGLLERMAARLDAIAPLQSPTGGTVAEPLKPVPPPEAATPTRRSTPSEQPDDRITCPKCGRENRVEAFNVNQDGMGKCPSCANYVEFEVTPS